MQSLSFALPLLALAAPAAAQTHWTVDDDGPADFADVAAAVAAVGAGDVLLIQPGNYGPVTLTKRLALLGDPGGERPQLAALTIDGAPGFDLAHLALGATVVKDSLGHARIDDCEIVGNLGLRALQVRDSGPMVLQRSTVTGPFEIPDGVDALYVEGASVVAVVDSLVVGGDAGSDSFNYLAGWGGHGLSVRGSSAVILAGSTVLGGGGDDVWVFIPPFSYPGLGGDAVRAIESASVDVRGSSDDLLRGGYAQWFSPGGGVEGNAVEIGGQAHVAYSGVSLEGAVDPFATPVLPPAPHLYARGDNEPGGLQRASVFGPVGAPAALGVAFVPALVELPGVSGALWLAPGALWQLVPLVLVGQDDPATHTWTLPTDPSFAGAVALLQAVVLPGSGPLRATNPAAIVLGF